MGIKIYGASDDLIEIEGDITEEFSFYSSDDDDTRYLAFSCGTLIRVRYDDDGIWRLNVLFPGNASIIKTEGNLINDLPDIVFLNDTHIEWVLLGKSYTK